jgi:PAS domain-containing protein
MKNRLKCLFFIFAINLCGWVFDPVARGADYPAEPFRVALIRSSSMYLAAAMIQDQAMRESLSANTQRNVEFYVDDLDTMRFPSAEFESQFLRLLRLKYQGRKIDLLMAVGPDALRFAQRHRADIWPGVPIVFYSVAGDSLQGLQLQPEVTGIILPFDLPGTIELAMGLQANAKRIVVVSGTSNYDQNWLRRAREALRRYENRFDISYWINQRLPELLEALRKLPPDAIVLYLSFSRDADGDSFVPRDMARSLAEASGAPVYGILGTYLGQGVVGGSVPSFAAHGKLAGEIAMRVLSGQKAGEIPVQPSAAAVATLDWRQLQRWNISESRLPPGAIVLFRPPSLWTEYRFYVIGAVAIVALQGLMIGGLLLQRSSRRRAEEERRTNEQALRFSEARYRAVVEDQTELICRFLPDGTYTFVNDAYCRYFQRSREQLLGGSFWSFIPPEGHHASRETRPSPPGCTRPTRSTNP